MGSIKLSNAEYALEFAEGLPASYTCTYCHQFLGEPYQNAQCGDRFCGDCVRLVTNGTKQCPECSSLMTKETTFVDAAVRREIGELEVCCPFTRYDCEQTLLYRNIKDHIESCSKNPVGAVASAGAVSSAATTALEKRVDKLEKMFEDLLLKFDKHVSSVVLRKCNNAMSSVDGDADAARQSGEMARRLQTLEEFAQRASVICGSMSSDVVEFETRMSEVTSSLQDLFARADLHDQMSHDGTFIWKIDDFRQKKKEAVDGVCQSVYSHPFYSHRFGFKMCARADLNGDKDYEGEYLSVYVMLMKGEYDGILDFPFRLSIKFTLMDQDRHSRDLSVCFDPKKDPAEGKFQRPTRDCNIGAGRRKFVPLSTVETPTYLKDDCIYLRFDIGKD